MAAFKIHLREHGGLKQPIQIHILFDGTNYSHMYETGKSDPLKYCQPQIQFYAAFIVWSVGVHHGKPAEEDTWCVWVHTFWGKKDFGLVNHKFPSSPTSRSTDTNQLLCYCQRNLHSASCCPLYLFWILASLKVALVILDTESSSCEWRRWIFNRCIKTTYYYQNPEWNIEIS